MALQTTVIGSIPKPEYLPVPSWVKDGQLLSNFIQHYNDFQAKVNTLEINALIETATEEVIHIQERIGIDIVSDGELTRENYIYQFCRQLEGTDFQILVKKLCRDGAWEGILPKIIGKIKKGPNFISASEVWKRAVKVASHPVKFTLPGPMTIADTMVNEYYCSNEELYIDLIAIINEEVKALASAGCKYIQIDEPVLVRYPKEAVQYGIKNISKCFDGLTSDVMKIVHCCCGYPQYLDQEDYAKAEQDAYLQIAEELDNAGLDAVSLEDAHRRNDLKLFSKFKKTKVILGVIDVVKSRIESVEEIQNHLKDVLQHIPRERLIVAPDCGLIFLNKDLVTQKLTNMVKAAKSV